MAVSAADDAAALYAAWLGALPGFFRAMVPGGMPERGATTDSHEWHTAGPHPAVRPVLDAMAVAQQAFGQLATDYARVLGGEASARTVEAWLEASRGAAQKAQDDLTALAAAAAGRGQSGVDGWGAAAPARDFLRALAPGLDPRAPHPVTEGLDRTFTALADAFGLAPSRALVDACRELSVAEADRLAAQAGYFAFVARTWGRVVDGVAARLRELGARGESIDSLLALVRLWAGVADRSAHEAMQSEEGLRLSAAYVRAATRAHGSRNRVVEILSELCNVPTQAQLDEAYREIQELKRRLRRLERRVDGTSRPAATAGGEP